MYTDKQVAAAMRQAGATAYLTKGGPSEDLVASVRACLPAGLPAVVLTKAGASAKAGRAS